MSSKSSMERRPTCIAQTPLQKRRIYFRSSAMSRRNWQQGGARNARASTNDGRAYGLAVACVARSISRFEPLVLTFMTLQRATDDLGDIPPVPDWMSDLAQQAGMSDGERQKAERDARWIGDFADELTAAIALREWDKAVDLVGQGAVLFLTARNHPIFLTRQRRASEAPNNATSCSKAHAVNVLTHLCSVTSTFVPSQPQRSG
jgi:hypothetical protein